MIAQGGRRASAAGGRIAGYGHIRRTDSLATWRCLGPLLLVAPLAGCTGRPPSAPAPVASVQADAHVVELLVSTTRREASGPAVLFNGERQPDSRFANMSISIPPGHVVGDISWAQSGQPDPASHFAAAGARRLASADFTPPCASASPWQGVRMCWCSSMARTRASMMRPSTLRGSCTIPGRR
jgi:hypothetical protein